MVAILRSYGTERMLVNSAADWGRTDPLLTCAPPRRCSPPGSTRTTSTGCCGATRSSSTAVRPARPRPDVAADRAPTLRGQLDPARRRAADAPPPPRRHDRPPRLLHQRAPGRGPRRGRSRSSTASRCRCASASASTVLGLGPVAGRARRPALAATPAAPPAARRARRARAGGGDPQRLPVPRRSRTPVVKHARLPAGLDRAGAPRLHRSTWPGPRRPAARRRRPRHDLHAAARLAHPWDAERQHARRRTASTGSPTALAAHRGRTGRSIRVALEPEPGCVVETTDQAVAALAGVDTDRLGVCLDLCHLACASEDPPARWPARRRGPAGRQGPGLRGRCTPTTRPTRRPARARRVRRAALPAPDAQRHPDGPVDARDDLAEALAGADRSPRPRRRAAVARPLPRAAARRPGRRSPPPRDVTARPRSTPLVGGDRAVTDHLEVETYTWGVLPPAHRRPHRRRPRRRHRRRTRLGRDQLRPRTEGAP